jgi:transglutaminase-like putative cysteine protease
MNTPAWLQALALLVWGSTLGLGVAGIALAALLGGLRLLAARATLRLQFDEPQINRSVDFTALLVVATLIGLLAAQGLPNGLLFAMGWMPAVLLPLLLLATLNQSPLRLRHLALSLRRSTRPEAAMVVEADAPYLAVVLLAAAVMAKPASAVFWLLGWLVVAWLLVARPSPRREGLLPFAAAAMLALGIAFLAGQGLQRAQAALQEWVIEALSGVDRDPYQSQTRIGDLGRVKLSERIVWRVMQTPPVEVPLLLRTGVFTQYVNGVWLAQRDSFAPVVATAAEAAAPGAPWLRLRGDSERGAALLPLPAMPGRIDAVGRLERNALGVLRIGEAPSLLDVTVGRGSVPAAAPPAPGDLALPAEFGEVLEKLPEVAALREAAEAGRVAGLAAWFAARFRYTLFIGDEARGRRDLQRFLLAERAGHCEYFATATVLLLRALGVPARYVTGYSVQEYSRLEGAFVLRKRHAHAWAEAWVDGRWVEVDTTPADWLGAEEQARPFWQPALDLASWTWRRLGELRRDLLGVDRARAAWVAGGLAALLVAIWLLRQRRQGVVWLAPKVSPGGTAAAPADAESHAFRALEQQFAELGLGRDASEPPRHWLARVARDGHSVLDAERLDAARRVVDALYRRRYELREG